MIDKIKSFLLTNRGTKQTVAKNVFWLSVGQIGSRLIRAVILIYAARLLGAENYGVFSYTLGLAGFFSIFADIGLNSIATREISQNPDKRNSIFSTGLSLKSFFLLLSSLLVLFVAPYFSKIEAAQALLPWIALLIIFDGLRDFVVSLFRADQTMEKEAVVNVATNVAIAGIGFAVLAVWANVSSLTVAYVGSAGLGMLAAFVFARREIFSVFSSWDKELLWPILRAAMPIALLTVVGAFMINVDVVMLGWWRTAEEVGLYGAGQRVVQLLFTLPAILGNALFPVISRAAKEDKVRAGRIMEYALIVIFSISLPVAIGGIITATPLITLLFGPAFVEAATSFRILILLILFLFPSTILTSYVLAFNEQKRFAFPALLGSLMNVALNAYLIPRFGITGAATATIVALGINSVLVWIIARRVNSFSVFGKMWRLYIASISMGILSYLMNAAGWHVLINISVSAIAYGLVLLILKEHVYAETLRLIKSNVRNSGPLPLQ